MTQESGTRSEDQQEVILYKPCLVIFAGLPLSGKSAIGNELARRTNIVFLDSDLARKEVFGDSTRILPGDFETFAMRTTYTRNHEKARDVLKEGKPVAVAATYSWDGYHEMIKWLAEYTGAPMKFFLLDPNLDREGLEARIRMRIEKGSLSNMRSYEYFLGIKQRYQVIQGVDLTRIDTTKPFADSVNEIIQALEQLRVD